MNSFYDILKIVDIKNSRVMQFNIVWYYACHGTLLWPWLKLLRDACGCHYHMRL